MSNETKVVDGRENTVFGGLATLTVMNCASCGGIYAINEAYRKRKYERGGYWACPYCKCDWGYSKHRSEIEQLKARACRADAAAQRARDERDTAERQRRGQKAAKTRVMNRIAKGECPCCGQQFKNLHRHMAKRHPDYAGGDNG